MIRVIHILEATLGGTRRYIENILEISDPAIIQSGLIYSSLRCDEQFRELLERCRSMGWELYEVPMVRAIYPRKDINGIMKARTILKQFKPQIVHCHSSKAGGIGRLAARSLLGVRPAILYSPHALSVYPLARYIEKWLAKITDIYIAVSESEKVQISQQCRVCIDKVRVVSPAIEVDYFQPIERSEARGRLGLDPDKPLVLGIGRLVDQKDPMTFVSIFKLLQGKVPLIQAIWVGDGELRAKVESQIVQSGLRNKMMITGWLEDVRPYIAAADVVLIPSRYEGFPYTVAEVLAMERPVVATRVTGTVDIISEGQSGVLFKLDDLEGGAEAVSQLLRSPAMAIEMGRQGRQVICQNYNINVMKRNLNDVYEQVVL